MASTTNIPLNEFPYPLTTIIGLGDDRNHNDTLANSVRINFRRGIKFYSNFGRGVYWRVALNGVLVASGAGVEAAYEVHGLQGDNYINIYLASGYLDVYLPYFQPTFIYDVQ